MPAGRIVLSAERHEPAVLPTTDLAEVNFLGEQTQLGEQLPDIPDKGSPRRWRRSLVPEASRRGPPPVRVTRRARSTPRGRLQSSWPGSPTGFTDRGLRELKGTVGRAPRPPGRA